MVGGRNRRETGLRIYTQADGAQGCAHVCSVTQSCPDLSETPWTVAHQVPLSMGFSRQEDWSGLPYAAPGDFPDPGIKPESLVSPASAGGFFTASTTGVYLLILYP